MKSLLLLSLGVAIHLLSFHQVLGQARAVTIDLSRHKYCSDIPWESPIQEIEEKKTQLGCQTIVANSETAEYLRSILTAMEIQSEKFTLLTTQQLKKCISLDDQFYRNIIINELHVNSLPVSNEEKKIIFIFSIAHEVAHHINGDFHRGYGSGMEWENQLAELNADLWAGKAIGKVLDVGQEQISSALGAYFNVKHDGFYHPAFDERILWVLGGWLQAESENWESGDLHQLGAKSYKRLVMSDGDIRIAEYESPSKQIGFTVVLYAEKNEFKGDFEFGHFEDGKRNGRCCYRYSGLARNMTGTRSFYNYKNGVASGYGEIYFKSGGRYFGNIENQQFHGFGVFTWNDGEVYIGEFHSDKATGNGVRFYPKEGQTLGQFVDWKFVQGSSDRFTRRKQ